MLNYLPTYLLSKRISKWFEIALKLHLLTRNKQIEVLIKTYQRRNEPCRVGLGQRMCHRSTSH